MQKDAAAHRNSMHTASDASLAARHGTQEFWAHGATRTRILGSRCYKDTRIPGSRCYKGQNSPPRCYVHSRVLLCAQMYCTWRQTPLPARFGTILRRQEFWAHGATRTRILGSRCYKGQNSPPRCYKGHSYLHVSTVPIDTLCSSQHNFSSKGKHFGHEWAVPEFTPPRHHATTPPSDHQGWHTPTVSSLLTLETRQRSIFEVVSGGMAVCFTWTSGFRWGSASFPILAGSRASAGVGLVRPSRPPSVAPHKTRFALSASVYAV